ncbi:MAG: coproporphyrinogen dehydrogenase HemZ, partial [Butyricicoccaceae bacterium]
PSRCSYCSFVSHSIEKAAHLISPYLATLCGEIKAAGDAVREAGLRIVSVYIGGGTPTTLSAEQLDLLLSALETCFDLSAITEFTVEAGRPDTITEQKLRTLAAHGVDRISINPQSMNDEVLAAIGRKHSAADVLRTYETARRVGFRSINMDTIAGLEKDTPESFARTVETLIGLEPENLTVHTLAVKRGATQQDRAAAQRRHDDVRKMLDAAYPMLTAADYAPYYLYRQKFMAGGYENTGWCKAGFECLYNVYMMEELQTILSLGAGGVTKLLSTDGKRIRRISNPKYPYEYNVSLEKISTAKRELIDWADTL